MEKTKRELGLLNKINDRILRNRDEHSLYDELCKCIVGSGGYKLAWICCKPPKNDPDQTVKPVASYGVTEYLNGIRISLIDHDLAKGPTSTVIKTGKTVITNDVNKSECFNPWLKKARKYGISASLVLPLSLNNDVWGALNIYSDQINAFDDSEVTILERLADNLSLAVENIRTREALVKSEANLKSIFDNTDIGYILLDQNYKIISFNTRMAAGYASEAGFILKENENFLDVILPERVAWVKKLFDHIMKTGRPAKFETNFINNNVRNYYVINEQPVLNNGIPIGICLSAYDITNQKNWEFERQSIINDLTNRNRDLEQFSEILSHGVRAPVATIQGLCNIIRDEKDTSEIKKIISGIHVSADHLNKIIRELNEILNVKTSLSDKKEPVDLKVVTEEVMFFLDELIRENKAKIKYDFSKVPEIISVRAYIKNIIYNLISHSIKLARQSKAPLIIIKSELRGSKIYLRFKDNGSGLDPLQFKEIVSGLHNKYQSAVQGDGLGLYMVNTQVASLNGHIKVKSVSGTGTEFIISFEI